MRLREKVCPKGCKMDGGIKRRERLLIVSRWVRVKQNRSDVILDWYCPLCGYTEPVNSKDIRRESANVNFPITSDLRERYELKTKG